MSRVRKKRNEISSIRHTLGGEGGERGWRDEREKVGGWGGTETREMENENGRQREEPVSETYVCSIAQLYTRRWWTAVLCKARRLQRQNQEDTR